MAAAPRAPSEPSQIGERFGQKGGAGVASGGESELLDEQPWSHALARRRKKMPVSVKKRLRETDIEMAKETVTSMDVADTEAQLSAREDLNQGEGSDDPDSDGGASNFITQARQLDLNAREEEIAFSILASRGHTSASSDPRRCLRDGAIR